MILEFATKRNPNGYRKYLGIDTDNKTFSRERGKWYSKEDVVTIGVRDRLKMIDILETKGYTEIERIF